MKRLSLDELAGKFVTLHAVQSNSPQTGRAIAVSPELAYFVTLNSFQGPSSLTASARRLGGIMPAASKIRAAERGAKWALKRVQGDDEGVIFHMRNPHPHGEEIFAPLPQPQLPR